MTRDRGEAALLPLTDALSFLLCGVDPGGRLVVVNQRCADITGIEKQMLLGQEFCAIFARDATDHVKTLWTRTRASSEPERFEAVCRNGRRVRWQFSHWPQQPASGVCAIGEDVTQETHERLQKRMRDRIRGLSNLGAGFAHELRNPLNSATLQLQVLLRRLAAPQDSSRLVERATLALTEIRRAATLIDEFLVFARPEPLTLRPTELTELVERAVSACRERAEGLGVRLSVQTAPPLAAELDAARVQVALHNLIANGLDAAQGADPPEVHVAWFANADSLVIEVRDQGPGLPAQDAPIFDPFFTTKPQGTGLGLSIVERVAADHGGTIHVERRGRFTVFVMCLPRSGGDSGPAAA